MPDCSQYDDKSLLLEIAAGDERAFRKLFELYKERFYSVALKMTRSNEVAEDIVQDVFMYIWSKRENIIAIENPSSYFFTCVYRKVYQYYRKIALEKKLLENISSQNEFINTTDKRVLDRENKHLISQAVAKLPPKQQLVFKLSKWEELSREEIARQLQISPHTVKNHLTDAIKFIRTFLRDSTLTLLVIYSFFKK